MVLKRLMPCLLYNGKALVKTVKFKNPSYVGDPINAVKIYNEKEVDELVMLDITATKENRSPDFTKIKEVASECFMPFAYGGGVKTLEEFGKIFTLGVEKVIVNSLIFSNPSIVREATKMYGAQSVVASVDYKSTFLKKKRVYSYAGYKSPKNLLEYCTYVQDELGVGELLLYSVDKDGTWEGYDYSTNQQVSDAISIPIIACGGAGCKDDLKKILYEIGINGAALGSMAVYQKKGMGVLIGFPKREQIIQDEHSFN